MADVILRQVSKRFGTTEAVCDLSLAIEDGEFIVLLGPSGAGKTTTLRLVAGLERPDAGAILIDDRDVTRAPPGSRDMAFVFQQYSLYPHLSVYDNLAFPLRSPVHRVPEPQIRKRVEQTAELLHIAAKLNNRATRLSGGEMQRVAIGRALVRDPAIYLMDEPLSSLDAKLRAELRLELKRIQLELGATILYVTHDQVEAMTMATRIGVIKGRAASPAWHASGNLRVAIQQLRRVAARHAPDQLSSRSPSFRNRTSAANGDGRDPHRAPADRQSQWRKAGWPDTPRRASGGAESHPSRI